MLQQTILFDMSSNPLKIASAGFDEMHDVS